MVFILTSSALRQPQKLTMVMYSCCPKVLMYVYEQSKQQAWGYLESPTRCSEA